MSVEFKCEHCDMLLSADVAAGGQVTCPHCQSVTVVPEGLASLPSPMVPGESPPPPPEGVDVDEGDEEEELEEEPGRSGGMLRALSISTPWLISLFFHGAILLILSLLVMYTILDQAKEVEVTKPVVVQKEPEIYSDQPTTEETESRQRSNSESTVDRPSLDRSSSSDIPRAISMSNTGSPGGGSEIPGLGGPGDGKGGLFGGRAPAAQNVVYVIDRSGSMHKTFGLVRRNLLSSIGNLNDSQDFHVILFATGPPLEKSPTRLTTATEEAKGSAGDFLQGKEARGVTDPIRALERAFSVLSRANPDRKGKLIYFLTDGNFPDNEAVFAIIERRNGSGGDVHINTFLYGNRPVEAEKLMKRIAAENRGEYKYVSPDEAY